MQRYCKQHTHNTLYTQICPLPLPLQAKQQTVAATENLPVCLALLGTQESPTERRRKGQRESREMMVHRMEESERVEKSGITKKRGERREERGWLADRSFAAFVTVV